MLVQHLSPVMIPHPHANEMAVAVLLAPIVCIYIVQYTFHLLISEVANLAMEEMVNNRAQFYCWATLSNLAYINHLLTGLTQPSLVFQPRGEHIIFHSYKCLELLKAQSKVQLIKGECINALHITKVCIKTWPCHFCIPCLFFISGHMYK